MAEATKYHTAEQNQLKEEAIERAIREFIFEYRAGLLASEKEMMYNQIQDISALITDLQRG